MSSFKSVNTGFNIDVLKIRGIQIDSLQNLSNVKFCINIATGGAHSCSASCGKSRDASKACSCDVNCYYYNDCCPDYEIFCVDGWQPIAITQMPTTEDAETATEDEYYSTTEASTSQVPPWYVTNHTEFYHTMDMLRYNIPYVLENRPINVEIDDTCYAPSLTPDVSYHMIATCPDNTMTDEYQLCVNDEESGGTESLIPVYVRSKGLFYANKCCAACHGHANEAEFLSLSCTKRPLCDEELGNYPSLEECQESICYSLEWVFNPLPRLCDPDDMSNVVINCPLQDDPISKACHSYSAYVFVGFKNPTIYRNVHCAFCDNQINTQNYPCDMGGRNPSRGQGGPSSGGGAVPLTVLFDFTSGTLQQSQSYGGPPSSLDCPEYFIYSGELHECRRVGCPEGATLHKKDCVYNRDPSMLVNRTLSSTIDPHYRRVVVEFAAQNKNITREQVLALSLSTLDVFYEAIDYYDIQVFNQSDVFNQSEHSTEEDVDIIWNGDAWMTSSRDTIAPEEDCLINYTIRFKVTVEGKSYSWLKGIELFIRRIEDWILSRPSCQPEFDGFDLDVLLVQVSMTNFPYVGGLCNESSRVPKRYEERSFSRIIEPVNHFRIRMMFTGNRSETFESNRVPQEVIFTGGGLYFNRFGQDLGNWSRQDRLYVCEGLPLCPLITLSKQDYRWQFDSDGDNVSLLLIRSNRVVPDNEIVLTVDGLVRICLGEDYINDVIYFYSSGQTLATTIGCTISLTLLGLVIITYCSFSSLRNVPGMTVLSLSVSLFFAQLLLLTAAGQTANSNVCLIIACFMHFFWLSVFSWTNVLAFDLGQTFSKKTCVRGDNTDGTGFIKYSIYGWGMPLLVVGVTLVVHFFQKVNHMIRNIYGVTSACWLRTGLPILIAFGVPVAIALLSNMVFFTRTVQGIRSTMKTTKILKKEQQGDDGLEFLKTELYLYVRVSIAFM